MQKDKQKVVAAIIAGVNAYIQNEEIAQKVAVDGRKPAVSFKLWSVMGREEIMRMRMLWQRRIV